jgi:dCTP deaminase
VSILTGPEIAARRSRGELTIEPFVPERLSSNSYDLTLGPELLAYTGEVLDPYRDNAVEKLVLPEEGLELSPDRVYLGASVERIGSDRLTPIVKARSGTARLGLYVHMTADLIDIGSVGQTTFQLHTVQRLLVYPGMVLAQVTFWLPVGSITLYEGKYQGSVGPQPSQSWRDTPAGVSA